jgi:hypothetical protein
MIPLRIVYKIQLFRKMFYAKTNEEKAFHLCFLRK